MSAKRLVITLAISLLFVGAGCAPDATQKQIVPPPEEAAASGNANVSKINAVPTKKLAEVADLPALAPLAEPIENESAWSKFVTKAGVTVTYPTKGQFAPQWQYSVLAKNDVHLQGNCYVTDDIAYRKTDFSGFADACQTTTAFEPEAGTRIDYFVFRQADKINLITFTKVYPAKFDQNRYGATLEKIIGLID